MSRLDINARVYMENGESPWRCQWFALCTNDANGLRDHPVLGPVPICQRCDDKYLAT